MCGSIVATIPMGPDNKRNEHTCTHNRNRNKWTNRIEREKWNNRTNILCNQLYQIRINYLMCVRLAALDVVFIGSFHFEWTLIASFSLMLVWPALCVSKRHRQRRRRCRRQCRKHIFHLNLSVYPISKFFFHSTVTWTNVMFCEEYCSLRFVLFSLFHFTSRSHRYRSLYIIAHSADI